MDRSVVRNKPFLFILFTAFLSIMGIGLIIPVVPFIVQKYIGPNTNAIAFNVGLLTSLYAFCQFFAAPVLGALSDKYGRKPLLLLCLLGSAIGYVLFGIGGSLWILFLARIIDGITGGDIGIAMAYVADVTKPQERGKYYGIIGATVGLGFMIGPTLGGALSYFGLATPLFFAAGLTTVNILFGYFALPESVENTHHTADFSLHHLNPFRQFNEIIRQTHMRTLIIAGMYYFLPFSLMSAIMSVYYKDTLHWTPANIGFLFLLLGIGDMFTQGFLSGKLLPKFGEIRLAIVGFFLTGLAFAIIAFLPLFPVAFLAFIYIVIYALGSGLFEPSFGALVSNSAKPHEQGRVQGAVQSMESIMRIIGPLLAAYTYQYAHNLPYIIAALVSAGGIFYVMRGKWKIRRIES